MTCETFSNNLMQLAWDLDINKERLPGHGPVLNPSTLQPSPPSSKIFPAPHSVSLIWAMALSRKQICAGELERDGQDDRTEFLVSLGILDTMTPSTSCMKHI
jgi:hypothetical protein